MSRFLQFAKSVSALPRLLHNAKITVHVGALHQLHAASSFHTSAYTLRKSGSSALEPKPRPPSKKQAKRHKKKVEREAKKKVDHKAEKLKMDHLDAQFNSKEMQEFIEGLRNSLDQPITQAMLPDGMKSQIDYKEDNQLFDVNPEEVFLKLAQHFDESGQVAANSDAKSLMVIDDTLKVEANQSLVVLAKKRKLNEAMHMYNVMNALSVPVAPTAVAALIRASTQNRDYAQADALFNEVLNDDNKEVDMDMWSAKIHNVARLGDPVAAETIMNNLMKLDILPLPSMYTTVLGAYVKARDFPRAYHIWTRMHLEDVDTEVQAFAHMFEYCRENYMAERAFFFWDEMTQAYKLEPTLKTCREFLLAVGRGPHFVKGFEDLMFDAMALIEGKELVPDAGIYEGIIEGFARARDPVAAEYYFWEMKRKNIAPTVRVYNYLLQAYFGAQTVGARKYGHFGRWSRPVAKEPTPDERDLAQLGPVRVAKILNSTTYTEFDFDKHGKGKRVKSPKYQEIDEDGHFEEEREEMFMEEVRKEAAALREAWAKEGVPKSDSESSEDEQGQLEGGNSAPKEVFLDDVDLEKFALGDPGFLQMLRLMKEDRTGRFDGVEIDGMVFRHQKRGETKEKQTREVTDLSYRHQIDLAKMKFRDLEVTEFIDPFLHMDDIKGKPETEGERQLRLEQEEAEARLEAIAMLDYGGALPPKRKPVSALVSNERELMAALNDPRAVDGGAVTKSDVLEGFDMVYCGRAPDADYSQPIEKRQAVNIHRAELAFQDMLKAGLKPNQRTLQMLLGTYCMAMNRHSGVDSVLQRYSEFQITPSPAAFFLVTKMHIMHGDLDKAMDVFNRMLEKGMKPDAFTYGLLVETHVHREKIVEALKILELASENKVTIPEKHMKFIRARCRTLGVKHPDLTPDPNEWIRKVKDTRRRHKQSSQRYIQRTRGLTFN